MNVACSNKEKYFQANKTNKENYLWKTNTANLCYKKWRWQNDHKKQRSRDTRRTVKTKQTFRRCYIKWLINNFMMIIMMMMMIIIIMGVWILMWHKVVIWSIGCVNKQWYVCSREAEDSPSETMIKLLVFHLTRTTKYYLFVIKEWSWGMSNWKKRWGLVCLVNNRTRGINFKWCCCITSS